MAKAIHHTQLTVRMSLPKATQCVTIICVYCIEHVVDIPSQDHHVAAASCFGGIKSRSS